MRNVLVSNLNNTGFKACAHIHTHTNVPLLGSQRTVWVVYDCIPSVWVDGSKCELKSASVCVCVSVCVYTWVYKPTMICVLGCL